MKGPIPVAGEGSLNSNPPLRGITLRKTDTPRSERWKRPALATGIGAILGVLLLHPATMAIYWLELPDQDAGTLINLWHLISDRMASSFGSQMLPMTGLFATLGAVVGGIYALVDARVQLSQSAITQLEHEMARDIPTLIRLGESEHLEFKSTVRWDLRQGNVNKALSDVVAKTLAAFANHRGGTLLVGVADDGEVLGLELDYKTFRHADRDGFAQHIMSTVQERLGGHVCRLVHVLFAEVSNQDVCRIIVEPSNTPIFFDDGNQSRLFVRTGNATRELDARETVEYVAAHWNGAAGGVRKNGAV